MIAGSGGGKVGNGVDGFLLIELRCFLFLKEIGAVEFGTSGGALRLAPLVVRSGKESFEAGPSVLLCRETFPGFSVIEEETGDYTAAGNTPYSLEQVIDVAFQLVYCTGLFFDD